ncbi:MAG: GTPase, partial [Tepidisphaeraceae bacterium]
MSDQGRAFLLTHPGAGAIAVIRIVGPGTGRFLDAHFSRAVATGRCVHGQLRDHDRTIDDPVVVLLSGEKADISVHGGPWVVRECLDLARRFGFDARSRPTVPLAADMIDADSPIEAEMLSHLPLARSELAVRALLAQPGAWHSLDRRDGASLRAMHADESLWRLLHPPRVAITGAANVGKSTLANQLFGQERSITADVPGTTRDWVGDLADVAGLTILLLDTPGMRSTADPIEQTAIVHGTSQIAQADLVILVLDATVPFQERPSTAPAIVVANKTDLRHAWNVTA